MNMTGKEPNPGWGRRPSLRTAVSALLLLAGAAVYALAVGGLGITFNATPLVIGVSALLAGLAGDRRHLIPVGLALCGWGVGVLTAAEIRSLEDRTTALHVVGFGAGLVLVRLVAPKDRRGSWLTSASIAVLVSGLSFLGAADVEQLTTWWAWALAMAAWSIWELRPTGEHATASRTGT